MDVGSDPLAHYCAVVIYQAAETLKETEPGLSLALADIAEVIRHR